MRQQQPVYLLNIAPFSLEDGAKIFPEEDLCRPEGVTVIRRRQVSVNDNPGHLLGWSPPGDASPKETAITLHKPVVLVPAAIF